MIHLNIRIFVFILLFRSFVFGVSKESKYIFIKSKHLGELYLTVHDDMRYDSSWVHGRYVHVRRKDEKTTKTSLDCSRWFLEPIKGSTEEYHIYVQSTIMGRCYLTVHRALASDKRDNTSTYVHARRWDARLEDNHSNHSIWYLEPVYGGGYHIKLKADGSYLNICTREGQKGLEDIRDESSLWVYTREKNSWPINLEPDSFVWYLEVPTITTEKILLEEVHCLKEENSFLKSENAMIKSRLKKIEEMLEVLE